METSWSEMEALFHKKIMLYGDLSDILKQEKKSIMEIDIDSLWKISEEKQKIASDIDGVRRSILDALTEASIPHDMDVASFQISRILAVLPKGIGERLNKAYVTLLALKDEVQGFLEENKRFVREYLEVLDDLIGIITDVGGPEPVYDKSRYPVKTATNLLLHQEV